MQNENQKIEYKESWRADHLKWICGFANAQGGMLYIGMSDDKKVVGVNNSKKLMEDIPNMVRDKMGIIVDVDLLQLDGKEFIRINVMPSLNPISLQSRYYYRTGSTLQELRGTTLDHFILSKQGKTWDGVPIFDLKPEDLDSAAIDAFKNEAIHNQRMKVGDVNVTHEALLEKLNLYDGAYLKRATAILFYDNPEKFVTGAFVKIGYFVNAADLKFQDEISL